MIQPNGFALLASLLLLPSARADLEPTNTHVVCARDTRDFCPKQKPLTKTYVDCMDKHSADLEPDCKEKIERMKAKLSDVKADLKKARDACRDDFFNLCQGVPIDESLWRNCLIRHERKLSASCLEALKAADAHKGK